MIGRIVRLIGEAKCYPYKIIGFEEDRDKKLLFSIQREGVIRKVYFNQIVLDPDKYTVYDEIKEFCGRMNLELREFYELDNHEYKITMRKF